ncbi:acyl-CoA dehydrogenase [Maritimibacter sp. DP07]|uniref:Acyl-CoA dehydrogenase n=1 Tax=Maritimibacter harenae TaxID=2606218 RepID=A0A845M2H6_9RHOB|nr:acyl-CoA dehydrogenase family protein [Maritimibacter harenae]MZR13422.1 acyl-CoA dehydrogenase [Maritimibacter harenae]
MDFTITPEVEDYRARIARFVEDEILPVEADRSNWNEHENIAEHALTPLREKAKAECLWALQVPREDGGAGLPFTTLALLYEEMNRSIFGPVVFHGAAPDDGNMRLMSQAASEAQKARWLAPVVEGKVRSAFVMTEPHPGGGSDPGMMLTTAKKVGENYVVRGRKWFITGAEDAQHFILVARTSDDPRRGLTAFLHSANEPGFRIERRIRIMGPEEHGGHCELVYEDMELPADRVLMGEGFGLKLTQTRLGPARLTHCMRWLGLSKRCMEIAKEYAANRYGFGVRLADRESIQIKLGDLAMGIEVGRLLVMKAAWEIERGQFAKKEISMAKIHVANLLHKAADVAIQINGARGYSQDTVLEWIYRYARQARLVDGADEVHQMVLNRHFNDADRDFWKWAVS